VGHAEAFGDPEVVDPPVVVGQRAFLASTAARRQSAPPERVRGARDRMGYSVTHGSSGEPEMIFRGLRSAEPQHRASNPKVSRGFGGRNPPPRVLCNCTAC
jgi:hypothetical protein